MRIAIIGQQDFGKAVLEAFLARGDDVAAVFRAPEKEGAQPDAPWAAAQEKGLTVHQFKPLRDPLRTPAVLCRVRRGRSERRMAAFVEKRLPRFSNP